MCPDIFYFFKGIVACLTAKPFGEKIIGKKAKAVFIKAQKV